LALRHDDARVAGRLSWLGVAGGWWRCAFTLDHTLLGALAEDWLRVGTPVSIGFDTLRSRELGESGIVHRQLARLNEVSLVDRGAYEGAQVISKIEIPSRRAA
jgi:hypothetical protein